MNVSNKNQRVEEIIKSATKVVLVCGREKVGKSSLVQILSNAYTPDVNHEYVGYQVSSNNKLSIKCEVINISSKKGDFMLNQKICLFVLSTMDQLLFQKQLAEIVKLCGLNDDGDVRAPVVDNINVYTKICAVIYVVKNNFISKSPREFYYNTFEYLKERAHLNNRTNPNEITMDEILSITSSISSILEIEKRVAYYNECNNLKWLTSHMSLKKVPLCLMINGSYDSKEIIIDCLLKEHLDKNITLRTLGESKSHLDRGNSLTEFYFKKSVEEKEYTVKKERLTKYCDILKEIILEIKLKGHGFGHLSALMELGQIEELKKGVKEMVSTRRSEVLKYKNIDEDQIPLNVLKNFLPLSNNSFGVPFIDAKNKPSIFNYMNNTPNDDMVFVCESNWGDEVDDDDCAQILNVVKELDMLENFKTSMKNSQPIDDRYLSPFVILTFWMMRCKNQNRY